MHIFIKKHILGNGMKELTYVPCIGYDYPDLQLINYHKMVMSKRRAGRILGKKQKRLN